MTTKFIMLNVWNTENIKVKVNQGEVNARFLQVQFIDKNQALDLENKQVFFFAKKPDGNLIFNRCEILDAKDGTIYLALTSQMSIVDGIMEDCEFDIIATDLARLKVKGLILEIEKCTDFDSATESTSEFTALEEAIAGYQEASDTIDAHVADKNNPHEVTATQVGAAESIHTHSTNDITSGTLPIARGGTNAASASTALSNLGGVPTTRTINSKALSSDITLNSSAIGAAESTHYHTMTDITNGTLPINMGGTGATTASDAVENLGAVKFSNVVQQKVYIPNQPEVGGESFKIITLTNPFRGNTTDKILGITSYNISGRFEPDVTGDRCVMYLNSPCPFDNTSSLGSIMVYNSYGRSLYVTTDSYIVVTSIKP